MISGETKVSGVMTIERKHPRVKLLLPMMGIVRTNLMGERNPEFHNETSGPFGRMSPVLRGLWDVELGSVDPVQTPKRYIQW